MTVLNDTCITAMNNTMTANLIPVKVPKVVPTTHYTFVPLVQNDINIIYSFDFTALLKRHQGPLRVHTLFDTCCLAHGFKSDCISEPHGLLVKSNLP